MSKPVVKTSWGRIQHYLLCIKVWVSHAKAYFFKKFYHHVVTFYLSVEAPSLFFSP